MMKSYPLNCTMVVILAAPLGCVVVDDSPRNILELAGDSGDSSDSDADRPGGPSGTTEQPPGDSAGSEGSPESEATAGDEGVDGSTSGGIDTDDTDDTGDTADTDETPMESPLIDDVEDGDANILEQGGRSGAWYTFNDGTPEGTQIPGASDPFTPVEDGVDGSSYSAGFTAVGFTAWGAGLGMELNRPPGMSVQPYDGSSYDGIRFSARGSGAVRFKLQSSATVSVMYGGTCTETCEDSHGMEVELDDAWTDYTITFDEATQQGWGTPAALDPATLLGVQFLASPNTGVSLAVDNVEFF